MDYAFAPGTTRFDKLGRRLFQRQNNTTLIHQKGIRNIEDFLNHLVSTSAISKPIEDLWILSHANDEGWMQIDLDGKRPIHTDYEVLDEAAKNKSVAIDQVLIQKPDGTSVSITVHIRGCRVGMSMPFMQRLKDALERAHTVTAPKHFYRIEELSSHGSFELLCQGFDVNSKEKLTRVELINAYQDAGFSYFDDTSVPDEMWDQWVPRNINASRKNHFQVNLGQDIGKLNRLRIPREYRYRQRRITWTITNVNANPSPGDTMNILRATISIDDRYQPQYPNPQTPYPVYQRYGYSTLDEFLNGWNWKFNWRSKDAKLICNGIRHEYEIIIPITSPPTDLNNGQLFFNFYPKTGTAFVPIENLLENDIRLFTAK
jgi:hypothetical protein